MEIKTLTEDQRQAKFYQTAYNKWPQIRGLLFSVPNGSTRHPLEAMKLKATGLTPGVPDLLLLWNNTPYGIEFKTDTGRLSPAQVKIHNIWTANGIVVHVFTDPDSALMWVEKIISK